MDVLGPGEHAGEVAKQQSHVHQVCSMGALGVSVLLGTALALAALALVKMPTATREPDSGTGRPVVDVRQRALLKEIQKRHEDVALYQRALREGRAHRPGLELGGMDEAVAEGADGGHAGLGCQDLAGLRQVDYLGSGFTKLVLKGTLASGRVVALKSVHAEGSDLRRCVQLYGDAAGCYRLATYKLLKELQGQCNDRSPDADTRVTAMLELGCPLEMIKLLQTPWEERFKICLNLVELLHYLAQSPLGSIALLDFQPRQFVLVDGELKVTDLDDASTEELPCREDDDCQLDFPTKTFLLRCSPAGTCEGINEKRNLYNAYRYFFTYLLPHAAPPALQPLLYNIMNATGDLRHGISDTLRAFQNVLQLYKSGRYLHKRPRHLKDYTSLKGFRIKETQDYKCWPSFSHLGCLLSVHNAEEAAAICTSHPQCRSFVIGQATTWTGRHLASFRSTSAELVQDVNSVVYTKRSGTSKERFKE
ncbi:extracellular tyrosine-protein kinase PKDCC-like isoform X2 [Ambystoma mexicanum]|uniref:extracellular tyrosine-protein kinase PKDCC-like isoform X2 n=1 Tax=Ambystoma mexicanum TaxID=8296 RepID=UPI0037E9539B